VLSSDGFRQLLPLAPATLAPLRRHSLSCGEGTHAVRPSGTARV